MVATSTGELDLSRFCASSCMGSMNSMYQGLSDCIQGFRPQLITSLDRDGARNATEMADSMLLGYKLLPNIFNFMCVRNEAGQFCMPKYTQLPLDIAAAGGSANISNVCNAYGNLGCCLRAMDLYYATIVPSSRYTDSLIRICPSLATYAPPTCLLYSQTAKALSVIINLNGLNCPAYAQKDADFRNQFQAAIKADFMNGGLNSNYTVIKSVSQANGVCSVILMLRAVTDTDTRALKDAAYALVTVNLTLSNQVLVTAPEIASATVTVGAVNVTEVTISGQTVANSETSGGSLSTPGLLMVFIFFAARLL